MMSRIALATALAAVALAAVAASAGPAAAEGRPDTRRMTCAEANALVRRSGAVVMTTGQHTFNRFVASWQFCDPWETTRPAYAPTRDNPRCVIRFVCADRVWEPFEDFGD